MSSIRTRRSAFAAVAALLLGAVVSAGVPLARAWTPNAGTIAAVTGGLSNIRGSAHDSSGNTVLLAYLSGGAVDFDPTSGVSTVTPGSQDTVVAKYDSAGDLLWVSNIGGVQGNDLAIDEATGNVWVTGLIRFPVDVDPSSATHTLTPASSSWDGFLVGLDSSGKYVDSYSYGGSSSEWFNSIEAVGGSLYIGGATGGTWTNAGPGASTLFLSKGGVVAKIDPSTLVPDWVKVFAQSGSSGSSAVEEVTADSSGNLYSLGYMIDTVDLNPGSATNNVTATGLYDAFWVKLDSAGDYVWGGKMSYTGGTNLTNNSYPTHGITVDSSGKVYVTGQAKGNLSLGSQSLDLSAAASAYILELSSSGTATSLKETTGRIPFGIAVSGSNLYTTGRWSTGVNAGYPYLEKLTTGGALVWRTKFSAMGTSSKGYDVFVDSSGDVWATGEVGGVTSAQTSCSGSTWTPWGGSIFFLKADAYGASEDVPSLAFSSTTVQVVSGAANSISMPVNCASGTSFAVTAGTLPPGLSLDPVTGQISGTPTGSGSYDFTVTATNSKGSASQRFQGTMVPAAAPTWPSSVTSSSYGTFVYNVAANVTVTANGAPAPTYAVTTGTLPTGLSLNTSTGAITGTPTGVGAYSFTITATNSSGSAAQAFSGNVSLPTLPSWSSVGQISGLATNTPYSGNFAANGLPAPTYSISAGALPAGLTLDTATGVISGTPTAAGSYSFTLRAENSAGAQTRMFSGVVVVGATTTTAAATTTTIASTTTTAGGGSGPTTTTTGGGSSGGGSSGGGSSGGGSSSGSRLVSFAEIPSEIQPNAAVKIITSTRGRTVTYRPLSLSVCAAGARYVLTFGSGTCRVNVYVGKRLAKRIRMIVDSAAGAGDGKVGHATFLFNGSASKVTKVALAQIESLRGQMERSRLALVMGHAAHDGGVIGSPWSYRLSMRRATYVADVLRQVGAPLVVTSWYGNTQLASKTNKSANRRVEVVWIKG